MQEKRRGYLSEPGEPLLGIRSGIDLAARFDQFLKDTRIPAEGVVAGVGAAIPLPIYNDALIDSERRWRQVPEAMLWHPMFWLPPRLAGRYELADGSLEPDDVWAARVAIESTLAGLYDPESGTWVDVFALVGIDLESLEGSERIKRWCEGGTDPDIESIDLSPFFDHEAEEAGLQTALALRSATASYSIVEIATELLTFIDDAVAPHSNYGLTETLGTARIIIDSAVSMLEHPGDSPEHLESSRIAWRALRSAMSGEAVDRERLIVDVLVPASGILQDIQLRHVPGYEVFMANVAGDDHE